MKYFNKIWDSIFHNPAHQGKKISSPHSLMEDLCLYLVNILVSSLQPSSLIKAADYTLLGGESLNSTAACFYAAFSLMTAFYIFNSVLFILHSTYYIYHCKCVCVCIVPHFALEV
jgi:predicted Co/Zn/Cd cation transporter (cation efflux family)